MIRVLGFRRAFPTVGRHVDLQNELRPLAAASLAKTFFLSPGDNICSTGECPQFCNPAYAWCGKPNMSHASFQVMFPSDIKYWYPFSPYRR